VVGLLDHSKDLSCDGHKHFYQANRLVCMSSALQNIVMAIKEGPLWGLSLVRRPDIWVMEPGLSDPNADYGPGGLHNVCRLNVAVDGSQ
jgi:hypothetical protein